MTDILDEPFEEESKKNSYSKKSYQSFKRASNLVIISIIVGIINVYFDLGDFLLYLCIGGGLFASMTSGFGLGDSYRSYAYKEENTIRKWIAIVGNLFFSFIPLSPFALVTILMLYDNSIPLLAKIILVILTSGFIALVVFIFYSINKKNNS